MGLQNIIVVLSRLFPNWRSPFERQTNSEQQRVPNDPRHRLGASGERLACRWLARNGYKVLYRNFRPRGGGEVDVVCRDRKTGELVFVEVKTRSKRDGIRPSDVVGREKQYLMTRGALAWLRALGNPDVAGRFDIVEVFLEPGQRPDVKVIQNAFPLPNPYFY